MDNPWFDQQWIDENHWFDEQFALDRDTARLAVRSHRIHSPTRTRRQRAMAVIHRDVGGALLSAPVVVPIWWGLWKVCDTFWGMK
jgi:hypothetical protein